MRQTIKVDILNTGMLFGKLKTPAYGVPIEYSLYETFKSLGFDIRPSVEKPEVKEELIKKLDNIEVVDEVKIEVEETPEMETPEVEHVLRSVHDLTDIEPGDDNYDVFDHITDDMRKSELNKILDKSQVKKWMTKEIYTKAALDKYTKDELICILNCRGHFCSRSGNRDPYAPKFTDTKSKLVDKVLATNAKG